MKKIIWLIVIATIFGCRKKELPLDLKGRYITASTLQLEPVIMYTKEGRVLDEEAIIKFLKNKSYKDIFIFTKKSDFVLVKILDISILENNQVELKSIHYPDVILAEIIENTSSYITVAHKDTFQYGTLAPPVFPIIKSRCDLLVGSLVKIISPPTIISSPNGGEIRKIRPMFPLEIDNKQLVLPFINYAIESSKDLNKCAITNTGNWNVFNSEILNKLNVGDTVIYQESKVKLIKQ